MNIAIAGSGYVGLVTAVCLAAKGHHITCVETDGNKIALLRNGKSPIYESGVEELMECCKPNLEYTDNYINAYRSAEVIFICVGTPERADGQANLNYVYQVANQIAEAAVSDCVVAVKSTVPVGINDRIEMILNSRKHKKDIKIDVVSNPEFLSQGTAVHDTFYAPRIVIGVKNEHSENIMKELYKNFDSPVIVTDRRSAEMIKYSSNNFLALKISYINEIANLCEIVGADIESVGKGMGMDCRIGNQFLRAGVGYGGSCFPKDTKALHWLARYHDYEIKTIKAAIEVNENQKLRLIKKARKYYDTLEGKTVAVLGLAFKPGTDDLRDAPSLQNIPVLLDDGAVIKAWDPVGIENFRQYYPDSVSYCESIENTIKNADLCLIFTEWDEIKNFDVKRYAQLMRSPIVLDGRNCYALQDVETVNIIYESIGRKNILPKNQYSHSGYAVIQKN